jgi:hypothetical protein
MEHIKESQGKTKDEELAEYIALRDKEEGERMRLE